MTTTPLGILHSIKATILPGIFPSSLTSTTIRATTTIQSHSMLLILAWTRLSTTCTISTVTWWPAEQLSISGTILPNKTQEKIRDSSSFQEAPSLHLVDTLLTGQAITTASMPTWITLYLVSWTSTCSVSLMLGQMSAVSLEAQEMISFVLSGPNLPLSIHFLDIITILTLLPMSHILWINPISLLLKEPCMIDINT